MNCPQCDIQLQDRAIYCPACGTQARCKQCREELVRDARVCMVCGTPASPADANLTSQPPTVNRIRFVETDKRRSLDAELTDDAVGLIGQSLGIFVTGQLEGRHGSRSRLHSTEPLIIDQQPSLPGGSASNGSSVHGGDGGPRQDGAQVPPVGGADPDVLLSHLDRSAHPEVYEAPRVLDRALHVLRIARDEYGIEALTVPQITQVLKDKFRVSLTPQSVYGAFDRVQGVVDRVPAGKGVWKFRLMAAGEAYLAHPGQTPAASARRRSTRRRAQPKTGVQPAEQQGAEAPAKPAVSNKRALGRPGPKKMVADLISRGYFSGPRVIGEVQAHIEQQLGYQFTTNELAPAFTRLLRESSLKRTKREDGQYEYVSN
jgi:hypothetical protein